ncbi:MAG: hypothetical protein A2283_19010 [Lentisphaerae bacterium RIFOXYA12_FULL_48_11]|nr:MAG: hypothetical protein A2283_19010 [Lentisphaerae bacterium RIFOXYA12_FULL_48_11]
MNISEETFTWWSQGPGKTETDKCKNAEVAVRKAIDADDPLCTLDISVFAQGSYKVRTNVRQDSDVDICIRYNTSFFPDYPDGMTDQSFGNSNGTMAFSDFKNMIEKALKNYFGESGVTRGKKAFDVHANSYRIDADVVPTFERRRYTGNKNSYGTWEFHSGTAFIPDNGDLIENWPDHNYNNGISRNDTTGRCYKRVIRILKHLRNKMQEERISESANIASFLIECLAWNAPLEAFTHDSYSDILRHVIASLWNRTRKIEDCTEWGEVNELKYLFRSSQPWTCEQANKFLDAAWKYIGFT